MKQSGTIEIKLASIKSDQLALRRDIKPVMIMLLSFHERTSRVRTKRISSRLSSLTHTENLLELS